MRKKTEHENDSFDLPPSVFELPTFTLPSMEKAGVGMCKMLGILWALLLLVFFIAASINPAHAISVKHNSVVTDSTIKLKDLFDGLNRDEDRVLGASPRPGQDMVLNARTLMRIAIALDLDWRPTSTGDFVVITRAATFIDRGMIEDILRKEIKAHGYEGKFRMIIPNIESEIILPQDMPATAEVQNIRLYKDRDFFEATIAAPSKANPIKTARISGQIKRMIDVPVLKQAMRNGEVIGKNDIEFIEIEARDVQHDMITDEKMLLGMTPRRMAQHGKPILDNTIQSPRMVRRGDTVTMTLQSGPLTLTARAKALEDGAKGDIIRVVNLNSNRTIEAEVSADREVAVTTY